MRKQIKAGEITQSFYSTAYVINHVFSQFNTLLHQKKIGNKMAVLLAKKQAAHTLQSFMQMQSKQLQNSSKINKISLEKPVKSDTLVPNSMRADISNNLGLSRKIKSIYRGDLSQHSGQTLRVSNRSKRFQIQPNNNSIVSNKPSKFHGLCKLVQPNQEAQLTEDQKLGLAAVKQKKFFIENNQKQYAQLKKLAEQKNRNAFQSKCNRLDKLTKYSFDYEGEVLESNSSIGKQKPFPLIRYVRSSINNCLKRSKNGVLPREQMVTLCITRQNDQESQKAAQTLQVAKIFNQGVNPISHLTQGDISQGGKLGQTMINFPTEKTKKRTEWKFKTLKQFKDSLILNKSFKQYSAKRSEKIKTQINSHQNTQPFSKQISLNKNKQIKSETESLHSYQRNRRRSMRRSCQKPFGKEKITVDNAEIFQDLCIPDS